MSSLVEHLEKKIIHPDRLDKTIAEMRRAKKTIATLNGSFDLLHAGHLHIIFEAKKMADYLVVALNSDESIRRYKAKDRPIISLPYRLQLMASLEYVDFVTWFEETDPRIILERIKPNVHVNGEEYGMNCIEADVVSRSGGKIHLVKRIESLSTSTVIQKIRQLCD